MKIPFLPFFCTVLAMALYCRVSGQTDPNNDSSFAQVAVNNAVELYRQAEGDQKRLYNGREYKPYYFRFVKGHPFFFSSEFGKASIHYDGAFYDNILLLYDEISEMIILNIGVKIELTNALIDQFTIEGHNFIHLHADSLNQLPASGFYEKLYNGSVSVYKKEKKSINDVLSTTEGYQAEALEQRSYYLVKGNRFYPVGKKKQLLNVLKDRKSEVQQYLKSNKLNYKRNTEVALTNIAAYYDQLTR